MAELRPLTEIFSPDDVIRCSCGSTAFFDWCVQIVAKQDYGKHSPRNRDYASSNNVRICISCHRPVMLVDGDAYDASMFVTSEQIAALIQLGQARQHVTPVRGMDP